MTLRAGIIGCGRIGSEFAENNLPTHAGAYTAVPAVKLAALADLDENKLARAGKWWGVTSLYTDYKAMLQRENLDILSICTLSPAHLAIATDAVKARVKAIYCEKPIADTLQNTDRMIQLCRESGTVLQVNHQRRFTRFYQDVREFLREGKLGVIQQVDFFYMRGIANTGSHLFDLLRFLFGEVEWVQAAFSQNPSHDPQADPNLDGMVKFRSGLFAAVQACDDRHFPIFELDCLGSKGRLNIIRNGAEVEYYRWKGNSLSRDLFPILPDVNQDAMAKAVEHLVACLREKKESISSGQDGRAALELICGFHESARAEGRRIPLPLKESDVVIASR